MSWAVSSVGTRPARLALASPIRGRSSKTSTRPSRSPSSSTVPVVGCISAAASRRSVVLPAPLGPSTTQRSSSSTVQSRSASRSLPLRRTPTPAMRITVSGSGTCSVTRWVTPWIRAGVHLGHRPSCRITLRFGRRPARDRARSPPMSTPPLPSPAPISTVTCCTPASPPGPASRRWSSASPARAASGASSWAVRGDGWWRGTADGVAAGDPYGLRVHGPWEPGRGVRTNPAKLLVDPWTRRVEGSVTSLAAARAFDGTDPFSARPDDHDSAGSVPHGIVTAPAGARPGRASRGAVAGHGDLRDPRPRPHDAPPGRPRAPARHLRRARPPRGRSTTSSGSG